MSGARQRVLVIGNGMVGLRFCERLREYDQEKRFEVITLGEERWPAYDRVQLTKYFESRNVDDLALTHEQWFVDHDVQLRLNCRVNRLDRARKVAVTDRGDEVPYDIAVLATGSRPFVPPVPGVDKPGVFVYRTIDDLEAIIAYATHCSSAAVLGGGLLGLEAAKAVLDLGLETHVVEFAPRLMPRQLCNGAAAVLADKIRALGVTVHTDRQTAAIEGSSAATGLRFQHDDRLSVDMVILSAGIRPRDELAVDSGIKIGERGGIVVDDQLQTSDASVYAVGECALHKGMTYGLVAPGYEMADVLAKVLTGQEASFVGADMSTKLKLMGVDVASFGDSTLASADVVVFEDRVKGVYKKIILDSTHRKVLGGSLVGDAAQYSQLVHLATSGAEIADDPEVLILGARDGQGGYTLPDEAQICSCNNVDKGAIRRAVAEMGCLSVADVRELTRAGTGCGGCVPQVTDLVQAELKALGKAGKSVLCEHFQYTRQELYHLVKVKKLTTFEATMDAVGGGGSGCEICKPTIASILASVVNELIVRHDYLQDTNDRFLANIQRKGLYSVVPRIPGGEITPDKLIAIGQVAKRYNLYTKITGGQRIDLFGAHVHDLPAIWEELVAAGFESGHAYGKALRTVKSCVGSSWCRYGVQDAMNMAIRLENRYKGIRSPHKLKSAVSGCIRECAEAQSKDFSLIATEHGYNVYVGGNGGSKPRHADLLIADVSAEDAIRYLDRFIMYYISTADKLQRTSVWLDKLEGGLEQLKRVILADSLGICADLEADMQHLIDTYQCEWRSVVESPELRAKFRHFVNSADVDENITMLTERGQQRPTAWPEASESLVSIRRHQDSSKAWVRVASASAFPKDGGMAFKYGRAQLAIFNVSSRGEWFATQNMCPHRRDMVLARGIVGDCQGKPKVACPLHKKQFSLEDGACLTDEAFSLATFPVKVEQGDVFVELPPTAEVERMLGRSNELEMAVPAE